MSTQHWTRVLRILGVAGLVALTSCDRSPTEPAPEASAKLSGPAAEAMATEAVAASWAALTTAEDLQLETLTASSTGPVSADAHQPLVDAGLFAAEAEDAGSRGRHRLAEKMDELVAESYLAASLALRGESLADDLIASTETALRSVEDAVSDSRRSAAVDQRLRSARDALTSARNRASRGDHVGALSDAVRGSDALRDLDPGARAKAIVKKAHRLLERAHELAGPEPRKPIARILREADAECRRAREALQAERWRLAVEHARTCGRLARRVLGLLSDGIPYDALSDRVEAMVAHAAHALERATEAAGAEPGPQIRSALEEAERLLGQARQALGDGEWREAVGLARRSAAISRRVVAAVSGRDHDGTGVQDRVEAAVEHAQALIERVHERVGDDVDPAVAEELRRAGALIDRAESELREGEWRAAYVHAERAIRILRALLSRLG